MVGVKSVKANKIPLFDISQELFKEPQMVGVNEDKVTSNGRNQLHQV